MLIEYYKGNDEKSNDRSSHIEVLLGKGVLKIYSKSTGEHPRQSAISIKLERVWVTLRWYTLRHGCSPVNLLHIFRTPSPKSTSKWLLWHWFISEHVSLRYAGNTEQHIPVGKRELFDNKKPNYFWGPHIVKNVLTSTIYFSISFYLCQVFVAEIHFPFV